MKPLCIIALVLGLGAGGVAAYHLAETWPHVKRMDQESREGRRGYRSARLARIEHSLEMSYRNAAFNQVYLMWGLGGLALIFGVLGVIKARGAFRALGGAGAAVSLFALIVSLTTIMTSRLG